MSETEASKPARHWFHVPIQLTVMGFCVYWHWYVPLPNKAVLLLGGVAAIMALVEMRPLHKAFYFALIVWLMFIETHAINNDRTDFVREDENRRREERQQFSDIGDTITKNVQKLLDHSDEQFAKNIDRSNRIIAGVGNSIRIQTGGDSYLWYEPQLVAIGSDALAEYKNSLLLQAFPRVIGHYSLPVAHVEVFGPQGWIIGGGSSTPALEYQRFGPHELARSRQGLSLKLNQEPTKQILHIFINTPNGSYDQIILIEKIGEQWECATRLYKGAGGSPLRVNSSAGFPKQLLSPSAKW